MSNPPSPGPPSDWDDDRPGWQVQHPDFHGRREPESYLLWGILCTLLCFAPFGIVSIF
jgi:hypothetical protein